ncbi:cysteine peptidase family C39 domain-containing protein, partial [Acinetobacter baumannii]
WNVESLSIKTNVDKLDEIPLPFITSFKQGFFVTVIGVANDSVEIINQNGVKKVLERGWFIKQWTETIVIAEANDKPG